MRLLLDAHLSPRRNGSVLEERGHDVLSLAADPTLGALDDPELGHHEFGAIIDGVSRRLETRPAPDAWRDVTVAV